MDTRPQEGRNRATAAALLGAFLFLLVASFLALPCMTAIPAATGMFSSAAGPQACQAPKLFAPKADLVKLEVLPPEGFLKILIALPVLAAALLPAVLAPSRPRPRAATRPRTGTLPFATSDPPKLPAFAALRDA